MPDDVFPVAGRCGMFVLGTPTRVHPSGEDPPILGVPGPGSRLDRRHGRVRSRRRARHAEAIPT
ncbi:hypothetical protein EJ357_20940 [Streptomyces cyaneochromogenes]|uniref:Uncharacterized protein n=1 Tax=Streptomyces cyaneochromogenes TaxID=2496836 RepID=A0A3S9M952_9ACTN|nr:hypothetical protein EJ357_20940 [Streptomyces cyaneochromogenes]